MIKVITKYEEIDKAQWNELLYNRSAVASFFQSPEAYELYEPFDWAESVVVAVEEDGILTGVVVATLQHEGHGLIRHLTSRAIINGGPLLDNNISEDALISLLMTSIVCLKSKCIFFETRNFNNYSPWKNIFERCGFKYLPHLNFHQDTSSIDIVNDKLSRTRKRDIRVGLRDGASIGEALSDTDIDEFYNILEDLYRHKVKKPLPPKEFFLRLHQLSSTKILIVKYQNHVIGGMAYTALKKHTGYEWYVCGMDNTYKKLHPSELATYAGLQYAATHGCSRFDYMGAGAPDESYGVREFKAKFGGTLVDYGRFLFLCNPFIYKIGKKIINILSKR